MEKFDFLSMPLTAFHVNSMIVTPRLALTTEAVHSQRRATSWIEIDSQDPLVRTQEFLKELIIARPTQVFAVRVVTKYHVKSRYLQLISITFPHTHARELFYDLNFVSELEITPQLSNFSVFGFTDKVVFIMCEDIQKNEVQILGLPLPVIKQQYLCSAKKGNQKLIVNIAKAYTGYVKTFKLK